MKHCDVEQVQKFRRKISLLHSIIAMPISNGYQPTLSQIREQDRQLLKKQAMEISLEPIENSLIISLLRRLRDRLGRSRLACFWTGS
jgi:hypothetical protein